MKATSLQRRIAGRVLRTFGYGRSRPEYPKKSYSQSGEDLIIDYLWRELHQTDAVPRYLDIGAHDATYANNTYLFYQRGASGVCVEPDVRFVETIKRVRPRDVCLPVGIGPEAGPDATFYLMSQRALSTFSRSEAEALVGAGVPIERTIQIPMVSINQVLRDHVSSPPDFVSLDTEGLDLPILQAFDFSICRPAVFCVETVDFVSKQRVPTISAFMEGCGYFPYADTYINTIFVDRDRWDAPVV